MKEREHNMQNNKKYLGRGFAMDRAFNRGMDKFQDSRGYWNDAGPMLQHPVTINDGLTVDSTGAFLVGELERLDRTLHEPLVSVTWGRDIDLREDVTVADEVTSFTVSTYGSVGGLGTGTFAQGGIGSGKAWVSKEANEISQISVDIGKSVRPLRLWALELKYTIPELESAAKLGRPIDEQKYKGLQLKHQMDIDEQVYIGDSALGDTGMVNQSATGAPNTGVTTQNLVAGASGQTVWTGKTPDEILTDINTALTTVWANSGWAVVPRNILIPPAQYGYIATQKVSLAGNVSILKYVLENNLLARTGQGQLSIFPLKWCIGAGVGGTLGTVGNDRMVVYTKDKDRVRYPMTLLQRTPLQYMSIWHKTTYFGRLGALEVVYPQTMGYFDLL